METACRLQRGRYYSKADIRARYRELALLCHPDKCKSPKAQTAFQIVTAAFRVLSQKLELE